MASSDDDVVVVVPKRPKFRPSLAETADLQLPWVEKYRPSSLGEVVAHEDIIRAIERMMETKQVPHLLLYGPPGTGKTSTITVLAKAFYEETFKSMILELNASDARGIVEQIKAFASVKQLFNSGSAGGQPKLVILDEADNMTQSAQFDLRRMIEQYASNVRFILVCNYCCNVIPALQSRCTKLRFAPLVEEQILGRLWHVARCENVDLTEDGARSIVQIGNGDMRMVLNILQTTSMGRKGRVDSAAVHVSAGMPPPEDIDRFFQTLMNCDVTFAASLQSLQELLHEKGYALDDFLQLMHRRLVSQDIPVRHRLHIMRALSDIDMRLRDGCSERLQLATIVGAFVEARAMAA